MEKYTITISDDDIHNLYGALGCMQALAETIKEKGDLYLKDAEDVYEKLYTIKKITDQVTFAYLKKTEELKDESE